MGLLEDILGRIRGTPPDAFAGLLSDQAQYGQPAAAVPAQWPFGPNGAPSQVGIPAPGAVATDISARARSPAPPPALAPVAAVEPASPVEPSMFGRLGSGIMSGLSDNSNALMAIGAGFAGAPNIGQAISRASAAVIPAHAADVKQRLTQQSQTYGTKALIEAGVPVQQAIAAAGDPDLKRALIQNYIVDRKGELKEIGVDAYGNKRFGVFDPFTRKIEPVNTGAGGVDNASAVDALVEAGVPRNLALAAQRSPEIMRSVTANYLNDRKGELKEIGVDRYGNKIMGVFDPFTKKITPVATGLEPATEPVPSGGTVASTAAPAGGATDVSSAARPPNSNPLTGPVTAENDITGPDYMERLKEADPAYARQVEQVLNGDAAMPTGRQAQTPFGRKLRQDVLTVEPGSSDADFSTRTMVRKSYTGGNDSKITKSINTTLKHAQTLEKAINDLDNFSTMPVLNYPRSLIKGQASEEYRKARAAYDTAVANFSKELDFTVSGGRPTVSGTKHQMEGFDATAAKDAQLEKLKTGVDLLKGRLDSHAIGYAKGLKKSVEPLDFINTSNRQFYKRILGDEGEPSGLSVPNVETGQAAPAAAPLSVGKSVVINGVTIKRLD